MSKLMSVRDFQREIAEIDAMLSLHDQLSSEHGQDAAAELMATGLRGRREELRKELQDRGDSRMPGHEFDLVFDGRNVVGNTIPTGFLGRTLLDLQSIVNLSIAHQVGGMRGTGRVKARAERAELRAGPALAGSYRLHIETGDPQFDLLNEDENAVYHALSALVSVFDQREADEGVVAAVEMLGSRAVARSQDLLTRLARSGAEMTVSWPTTAGFRHATMPPRHASQRRERLSRIEVKTYTEQHTGRLDEAGIRRGYFEFINASNDVLAGKVRTGITSEDLERHFNKACHALFTVTRTQDHLTGRVSYTYRLDQLAGLGEPLFPPDDETE